jgi:hypothetical protein
MMLATRNRHPEVCVRAKPLINGALLRAFIASVPRLRWGLATHIDAAWTTVVGTIELTAAQRMSSIRSVQELPILRFIATTGRNTSVHSHGRALPSSRGPKPHICA